LDIEVFYGVISLLNLELTGQVPLPPDEVNLRNREMGEESI
jgi:hypothetical protein